MKKLLFNRLFWVGLLILLQALVIVSFTILTLFFLSSTLDLSEGVTITSVIVFLYLLSFFCILYMINSRISDAYIISWIAVIALVPGFGALIYLLAGNKKYTKRQLKKYKPIFKALRRVKVNPRIRKNLEKKEPDAIRIAEYINAESGSAFYDKTQVDYYPTGEKAWECMLSELKKAKHYIFMEYFIIEEGLMWNSILDILIEKVAEGVDVRVMYDDMGCISTLPTNYLYKLRKLGIKCIAFGRFNPFLSIKVNNRDHRKILVIDGHTGFTGGINLADEYINAIERFGHWKDNAIRLKGEGVYGLTMLFLSNWQTNSYFDEEIDYDDYLPSVHISELEEEIADNGFIQPYGDVPFNYKSVSENVYLSLMQRANNYLYIATPYLIIDSKIRDQLILTAKQGVEVILLTPHIPDKPTVFGITRSYYKSLISAGVRVFEYTPGFIHMKMFISDDKFGTVGTVNLDYRSLFLHLECGCFMYDTSCIVDMKKDFLESLEVSEEITMKKYEKISRGKRFWWAILRLFAPLM